MSGLTDAGIIVASCAELLFSSFTQWKKTLKGQKTRGQQQLNDRKLIDVCMSWIQTGSVHRNTNRIFQKQLQHVTVLQWIRCFCLFNSVCINSTKIHSNVLMSCMNTLNDNDKDEFVLAWAVSETCYAGPMWQKSDISSALSLVGDKYTVCWLVSCGTYPLLFRESEHLFLQSLTFLVFLLVVFCSHVQPQLQVLNFSLQLR